MSTSSDGRNIATTKSGHKVVTGPEISKNPPVPPAGPVPGPYVIAAKSSTAKTTGAKLIVKGGETLTVDSVMDADRPANQPSQPTGGDVANFAVSGKVPVTSGTGTCVVSGKDVARTGDTCATNTMTAPAEMAQMTGILVGSAWTGMGGSDKSGDGSGDGSGAMAKPAQGADTPPPPGTESAPENACESGHPVAVQSGFVVDREPELELAGAIPLSVWRHYSSQRHREDGLLGRGGWSLSLDQWVRPAEASLEVRLEDGRSAYFEPIGPGESWFHRRSRLELFADATPGGAIGYRVFDERQRLWRHYRSQVPGGPARLVKISDAYDNAITFRYADDRLAEVIDTAGRVLRVTTDERGHATRLEVWARPPRTPDEIGRGAPAAEPTLQQHVDYAYDDDQCLRWAANALGHGDRYTYDEARRVLSVTLKNGTTFRYRYDPDHGRCIKTWGDDGLHTVELDFRPDYEVYTSGNPEPRHYVGAENGETLLEETLDGTFQRHEEGDDDGHLLSEANAAGETTRFTYDERARRTTAIDPAGNETAWAYDERGRCVARVSPEGHETSYRYDDKDALIEARYPTGEGYQLSYDGRGRLTAVYGPDGLSFGFAYDEHHNLVEQTTSRGERTRYRYDALGRPIERTDAADRVTTVTYDAVGQAVAVRFPDGTSTAATYDPLGNVASFTDGLGQTSQLSYAGTGVLVELIEPTGQRWRFAYDKNERLRRITNPRREEYRYRYDAAGRVVEERPFDGRVLRYQYDLGGRLSRMERPDGSWRAFHYSPLGAVVAEQSPDGGITYQRDKLGRLLEARVEEREGDIVTVLERDTFGRVVAEVQDGYRVAYGLDGRGRRVERRLSGPHLDELDAITRYEHDPFGAFVAVTHEQGPDGARASRRLDIERDAMGRPLKRRFTGGQSELVEHRRYDLLDRLVEQSVERPEPFGGRATELVGRRWRYDAAGRPTAIDDDRWGTTTYGYDPLGQLIEAKRGGYHEVFEYDVTGSLQNILGSLDQVGQVAPWKLEPGNVLTEREGVRYENDRNKRRVLKVERGDGEERVTSYEWDVRDRLREVGLPDGRRLRFRYDAFARRVDKELLPATGDLEAKLRAALNNKAVVDEAERTRFVWDGDVLAAEVVRSGGEAHARVHVHEPGSFVPLMQAERGEVFVVVNDHLGMPKELVDGRGRVAWAAAHSAWGRVLEVQRDEGAAEVSSPFRLLGQYADEETGLCYTRFRYFDAEAGRWCSADPLGFGGGANLVAFDGSPTLNFDVLGLACPKWARKDVLGRRAYQRDDLIDASLMSSWFDRRTGTWVRGTNRERMASGLAPIGPDGRPMQLHHLTGDELGPGGARGPVAEVTSTMHNKVKHGYTKAPRNPNNPRQTIPRYPSWRKNNSGDSTSRVDEFNQWRQDYWTQRAEDF